MIGVSLKPNVIVCNRPSELKLCLENEGPQRCSRLRLKLKAPPHILFVEGSGTLKMDALDGHREGCHDLLLVAKQAGTFSLTVSGFSCRNAQGRHQEFPDQTLSLVVEEAPAGADALAEGRRQDFDRALAAVRPRLLEVLARCGPFASAETLRDRFGDPRLRPWRSGLPERRSQQDRVEAVVSFLQERQNSKGEQALILFLQVLAEGIHADDLCRRELLEVVGQLKDW